ncbi:MAG: sialate O-acetylesterase [Pyrinomonadaceae bacterium]
MLLILAAAARADVRVPSLIGDNMVLQQGRKVRVWGRAEPGERVTVTFQGDKASATADARGRWEVYTGPHKAGGPFELTVAGRNTLTFKNVLVGDVWVCSGQSNMEWVLANAQDGAQAAAGADYPFIHLFTVTKKTSAEPLEDVEGRWVVTTPKEAAQFSAVGYFFGRELYKVANIPLGLIHTSWGGTPAEAWTSRGALAADPALKPILDRYDRQLTDLPRLQREYDAARAEWERQYVAQDPGNKGEAEGYAKPGQETGDWKRMKLPQFWESAGLDVDGVIWFRREVEVPAAWAGKELTLKLGAIDDFDTTYFNGERVGATGPDTPSAWVVPRLYRVPGSLVRAGSNTVAVRVFDRVGGGGFGGGEMSLAPADSAAGKAVALEGEWLYKEEATFPSRRIDYSKQPQAPGPANQNSPTVLYNAMLAPLFPYAIRGAIWYQGESNAGRAYQYRTLFPAMIRDWRAAWKQGDFPFYFVQLANWKARPQDSIDSEWAELREAQTLTLKAAPNTGMAVTIDIGNPDDIHPRNKLDVGLRLAYWALADVYGMKNVEKSGPLYDAYKVEGDKVRVRFTHAGGLKTRDGAAPAGFYVAGADRKFVPAEARIEKGEVVVWSKEVPAPVAVRYAWADNPSANLYNSDGLPASPFRTDDWPGVTAGRD